MMDMQEQIEALRHAGIWMEIQAGKATHVRLRVGRYGYVPDLTAIRNSPEQAVDAAYNAASRRGWLEAEQSDDAQQRRQYAESVRTQVETAEAHMQTVRTALENVKNLSKQMDKEGDYD